jgi:translation initiation factor IF-3
MFLFLAPKKAAQAKKSQQKMDRERREAEAKETGKPVEINEVETEAPANGGLFANVKGGEELLKKLQDSNEE